jgi:Taurine catabolism dioxygenase TauD, TfdA family
LILQLGFEDPESEYLLQLVLSLEKHHEHGPPLTHSSTRGWFWDVKPQPESVEQKYCARSETMGDFPWHTDCSYVSRPPRFFGLHVLQADRCGGGTLSVLQVSQVAARLKPRAREALYQPEFRLRVPAEFSNGTEAVVGPLFSDREAESSSPPVPSPHLRCRFRADIVVPQTARARAALGELDGILLAVRTGNSDCGLHLTPDILPNGSIVLLDNGRWLHARNKVHDPGRHLRRVRWDARAFGCDEM